MNHALVIASRELRERYRIFLMAIGLAFLPFLATLLPAAKNNRVEMISILSGCLAVAMAFGVSVAHGASTIAGDLAEKRLSYYFSKPISPAALWFGKTIAALLASYVCFAIIAVPAMLALRARWWAEWLGGARLVGLLAAGVVVLYLISHVLSTMVRSRSALVGIDFVFATVAAAAVYLIIRPVLLGGAGAVAAVIFSVFGFAFLIILVAAPVWQLAKGRTDIRRSHAALSRFLWTAIGAVLLVTAAYVGWLVSVEPQDLNTIVDVEQAPAGNAVTVVGMARGRGDYGGSFIIDRSNGSFTRMASPPWWGGVHYSRNGSTAAWLQPTSIRRPHGHQEVYARRLDQPDAKTEATGITGHSGLGFVLSDDGSRIAAITGGKLLVHDLRAKRLLTAVGGFDRSNSRTMFFVTPDLVRVMTRFDKARTVHLFELNVATKKLVKTGQIETSHDEVVTASADGSRVLLSRSGLIADGRSGAPLATLPVSTPNRLSGSMLNDGMVAMLENTPGGTHLYTFDRDGRPVLDIAIPTSRTWLSGQLGDRKLILLGNRKPGPAKNAKDRTMFVVDLDRAVIERAVNDVKGPGAFWSNDARLQRYAEEQQFAGVDADGKLIVWDPKTGSVTPFPRS